jgi:NADPH2:quinone reductase
MNGNRRFANTQGACMEHIGPASDCNAWVWHAPGALRSLTWERVVVASPEAGEVLIRNRAAGLNPVDWKFIEAGSAMWQAGHVPGVDGAGEVVALGEGVSEDWLTQRVAYHQALTRPGSFAEYVVVPARALMRLPPGISFAAAAALPCAALTAWQAIRKVPVEPGMPVLVTGAGGAVGTLLVQLAIRQGCRVAMCHPRHWSRMERLGVLACIASNARQPADEAHLRNRRFDAIFDTVSGEHAATLAGSVSANGHLVCAQDRLAWPPLPAFTSAISLHEVALNAMHGYGTDGQWRALVHAGECIMADVASGMIAALPPEIGPMDALPELLERLRTHAGAGRPVAILE